MPERLTQSDLFVVLKEQIPERCQICNVAKGGAWAAAELAIAKSMSQEETVAMFSERFEFKLCKDGSPGVVGECGEEKVGCGHPKQNELPARFSFGYQSVLDQEL